MKRKSMKKVLAAILAASMLVMAGAWFWDRADRYCGEGGIRHNGHSSF